MLNGISSHISNVDPFDSYHLGSKQQEINDKLEQLYGEYRDRLFYFALKNVGSREAAEDIVSETFLAALEKLTTLKNADAFGAWLYSIAYNKCNDHTQGCNMSHKGKDL